jgi:hypothetical protein
MATRDEAKGDAPRQRAEPTGPISSEFAPVAATKAAQIGAATLLAVESKVRAAKDETELVHLIANELRKLVGGRQAIVLRAGMPGIFKVACVSSLVVTDKESPFLRWIEGMARQIVRERGDAEAIEFELPAFVDKDAAETLSYPFTHIVWQPLQLVSGETFAAVLVARERPWLDQDRKIIARETGVFASIWQAIHGAKSLVPKRRFGKKVRIALAAALVLGALVPVPMTTLAPVEIVAKNPQRVTAPIDGVIEEIFVDPNQPVKTGQPLLRFEETTLRNRFKLAEQEMLLARARFDRATHAAFTDQTARHEIAQAQAELDLKQAESDYAADLLARSVVSAARDGILVYTDKDHWIGRPVKTGERIMQIVDPSAVAARIEVPVADAIVLQRGARVRMFLDANPLTAISAQLVSEGYHAEPNSTQQLVYRLQAEVEGNPDGLRIGARGTAQLQGDYVPLIFYLLRRPISSARQHLGL